MKKLALLLMSLPVLALGQKKMDIETLWQFGRVSEPQVSPDGKLAIFGVKTYDLKANKGTNIIYSKAIIGKTEAVAITGASLNAFAARFTPDGKKISFLSVVEGEAQLFEMNLDGTNKNQVSKIKGGINGYKYAPTMKHIAYVADVKLDQEVKEIYPDLDKCNARIIDELYYRHWDAWHDYAYSHLFVIAYSNGNLEGEAKDIMLGERFDCPVPPHGDDDEFNWNPAGTILAYDCKKLYGTADALSTNSDIYVYELATGLTKNISESNKGYDKNPQFSPDGSKIAWLSMPTPGYESDRNTLVMANLQGDASIQKVSDNFDYTLENFCWIDNSRFAFTATMAATKQICLFDPKLRSVSRVLPLTKGNFDYGNFCFFTTNKKPMFLASKMSISMPSELFLFEFGSNQVETQFSFANKTLLSELKMGKVEQRMVKTTDNKDMLVWVIYPPDFDPTKKYPTLLYCQGGPQSAVSQFFSYRWNFQLMAAKGYIVVAPNRRGLPGFGSEWNDAIQGDYGGQCMKDYLSAIDAVAKESYVDKNKLGAVGASFGGYSVYWLAGNHNKRFKTFIAHCGMFNMESWYGTTEEMFFANSDNKGPYWEQKSSPNNFDASPHKFVKNWDTPILVIHNEKDYRVPLGQGMEAFTAAQVKGIKSKFLYFPDENHWVVKPQNSILWQRVFFDWLDQTIK